MSASLLDSKLERTVMSRDAWNLGSEKSKHDMGNIQTQVLVRTVTDYIILRSVI
jgi:hypothetical protein